MSVAFVASPRPQSPLFTDDDYRCQRAFFAAHPTLAATPLHRLARVAQSIGIAELWVKDETARFGLNSFKAAGAMFAVAILRQRGHIAPGATLVCASEGNHGRAVARAARDAGCAARVYVAADISTDRVSLIEAEGAHVERVAGSYDDALRRMEDDARTHGWTMISDTATPGGDTEIPRLIMLGYTRLMDEAEAAWAPAPPDVIFVPAGVGGLLGAVASWLVWRYDATRPRLIAVEPLSAACVQAAARAARPVRVTGPFDTIMAGLRCREVSHAAFPAISSAVDGYLAIEDSGVVEAMRQLKECEPTVAAGASGAAALGGLLATLGDPAAEDVRRAFQIGQSTRAMVLVTEGVSTTGRAVP